jgi:hypothetical protein
MRGCAKGVCCGSLQGEVHIVKGGDVVAIRHG